MLPVRFLVFFVILTAASCAAAFRALNASHLFFVASTMRLRPAALSFRFLGCAAVALFCLAQRFLWAAAIRASAATDKGRLVRYGVAGRISRRTVTIA